MLGDKTVRIYIIELCERYLLRCIRQLYPHSCFRYQLLCELQLWVLISRRYCLYRAFLHVYIVYIYLYKKKTELNKEIKRTSYVSVKIRTLSLSNYKMK